jgi:hypothetical protein
MMEPLLEQQRRYHEERERLLDSLVGESLHSGITPGTSSAKTGTPNTATAVATAATLSHRETVNSMHRSRRMIDR